MFVGYGFVLGCMLSEEGICDRWYFFACLRTSDGLEEEREAGIFWDKVVEIPFGVVSGGWYWVGGFGRGVFMMVFHLMACVF